MLLPCVGVYCSVLLQICRMMYIAAYCWIPWILLCIAACCYRVLCTAVYCFILMCIVVACSIYCYCVLYAAANCCLLLHIPVGCCMLLYAVVDCGFSYRCRQGWSITVNSPSNINIRVRTITSSCLESIMTTTIANDFPAKPNQEFVCWHHISKKGSKQQSKQANKQTAKATNKNKQTSEKTTSAS